MMLFWFGWISGLSFVALLLSVPAYGGYCLFVKKNAKPENTAFFGILFASVAGTAYLLIGLSECVAFPGEMGLTMFMIALLPVIKHSDNT